MGVIDFTETSKKKSDTENRSELGRMRILGLSQAQNRRKVIIIFERSQNPNSPTKLSDAHDLRHPLQRTPHQLSNPSLKHPSIKHKPSSLVPAKLQDLDKTLETSLCAIHNDIALQGQLLHFARQSRFAMTGVPETHADESFDELGGHDDV